MHSAATLLLPVLAAEKSRVPFYIAGGLLAMWAVIVAVLLGLRRPEFPGSLGGERVVIAITVVLVLGAISMAVVTSSAPPKAGEASASSATPSGPAPSPAPAAGASAPAAAPGSKKPATTRHGRSPKATTGTPTPPSSPARTGASAIALVADPSGLLSYDKKQLSAKAGSVTIALTNSSTLEHNVTIAEGSKVLGTTPTFASGSRTLTLALKAGTYTFYCSVPGHRQGGMEGTLTVA